MVETRRQDWEGNINPACDPCQYRLAVRQGGAMVVDLAFDASSTDEIWHYVARSARYIDPKSLCGAQIQVFDRAGGIIVSVGARTALRFLLEAKPGQRTARTMPQMPRPAQVQGPLEAVPLPAVSEPGR